MDTEKKKILINGLIAIFIGGALFLGVIAVSLLSQSRTALPGTMPRVTIIEKSTSTPTISPTEVGQEEEAIENGEAVFRFGSVVQIVNTGGAGLRLRSNPGTGSAVQFIGEELELFTIVNGPVEQDGYVWWYLESPYDTTRSGWAAADYLQLIDEVE